MHSPTAKRRTSPCDLQESQGNSKCMPWFRSGLQNLVYVLISGLYGVTDGSTSSKTLHGKPTLFIFGSTCALLRWLNPDWNIVWLHCIFSLEERFEKTQWLFRRRGHGISASLLLAGFVCENVEKCERFREEWYRSGRQGWLACFSPQRHELYSFRLKEQQHQHNEAGMLAYLYWHSASRHHTHILKRTNTVGLFFPSYIHRDWLITQTHAYTTEQCRKTYEDCDMICVILCHLCFHNYNWHKTFLILFDKLV